MEYNILDDEIEIKQKILKTKTKTLYRFRYDIILMSKSLKPVSLFNKHRCHLTDEMRREKYNYIKEKIRNNINLKKHFVCGDTVFNSTIVNDITYENYDYVKNFRDKFFNELIPFLKKINLKCNNGIYDIIDGKLEKTKLYIAYSIGANRGANLIQTYF